MKNLLATNYRKNLKLLFQRDALLAHKVNRLFSEVAQVIEGPAGIAYSKAIAEEKPVKGLSLKIRNLTLSITSKGTPTAFVTEGTKRVHLHSAFDPEAEARKLFDEVTFDENTEIVMLGVGLGYGLKEILKKGKPLTLIVIEWSLEVFLAFMLVNDLEEMLGKLNTIFIVSDKPTEVREKLSCIKGEQVAILSYFPSYWMNPPYYEAIVELLREIVYFKKSAKVTLERLGLKFLTNLLINITRSQPIKRIAIEDPVAIVGASPGLMKTLSTSAELLKNYIIITTDVALPLLIKFGIKPELIVSVDPNPQVLLSSEFGRLFNTKPILRIGPSTAYPLLDYYFSAGDPMTESLPFKIMRIEPSGNVGATALDVAISSGVPLIVLIGIDFAFPSLLEHYPPGTAREEIFLHESSILFTYHNFNFSLSFQGTPIKTDNGWEHTNFEVYRAWLKKRLKEIKETEIIQIAMNEPKESIKRKLRMGATGRKKGITIESGGSPLDEVPRISEEALRFFNVYDSTEKLAYLGRKLSALSEFLSPPG